MSNRVKIVIDNKIPMIQGALSLTLRCSIIILSKLQTRLLKIKTRLLSEQEPNAIKQLLEGSSVKFIATATIGYDHIDTEYCDAK